MLPLLTLSALLVPVTKGQWQENSLINISRIISKGERLKDAGCAINTPSWPLALLLHSPETANSNGNQQSKSGTITTTTAPPKPLLVICVPSRRLSQLFTRNPSYGHTVLNCLNGICFTCLKSPPSYKCTRYAASFFFFYFWLDLRCCAGSSLVAPSSGYSAVMVCSLLTAVASPGAEHRL